MKATRLQLANPDRHTIAARLRLRGLLCAFVCGAVLMLGHVARAQGATYARVTVDAIAIHSGPGSGFRRIFEGRRGDTFEVLGRAATGYWLRIRLPDARIGFVRGDAVLTHELGAEEDDDAFLPWLLSPPALPNANGELALMGGALGDGGIFGARGSLLLAPSFGVEASAGVAVASSGRLVLTTVGPIVNLFAASPVGLLATIQAGIAASSPNADTFLLTRGSIATFTGGIGVRVSLHYGLTLRVELRSHAFVEPDRYVTQEELSAGLAVFL